MRISRVYTRTGDHGLTRLVMGREVSKDHVRIQSYGDVDELNAVLGVALAAHSAEGEGAALLREWLELVQHELFDLGADLATRPEDRWPGMHRLGTEQVTRLEQWMDRLNEELPPLEEFILPGGGMVAALLHQARTVCRRAERRVVTLMSAEEGLGEVPVMYLNRLSDALFVFSRYASRLYGEPEVLWRNPSRRSAP
ncbi:MAG: cob(I)yrinic acid a,c-diamide adenosyltransferase [Deltaproteobacteria bacterium]|nr:cob(I)yrinic acid a,c-diamide adenosyltransferase [Deltaproteobacteria bacterium]